MLLYHNLMGLSDGPNIIIVDFLLFPPPPFVFFLFLPFHSFFFSLSLPLISNYSQSHL
jgi:hypothetical protein